MRKVAFFDFCETLANFQTADAFVDYVREIDGTLYMSILDKLFLALKSTKVIVVLNKLFPKQSISKTLKLLQLRGKNAEKLESIAKEYYERKIRVNLITPVLNEMLELAENDFEVSIVSAGYTIYLKYFAKEFNVMHLIATEIDFNNSSGYCYGRIKGMDCVRKAKVDRIKQYFSGAQVDFDRSISYSDSKEDLPLLNLSGSRIVISHVNSQNWAQESNFREIIWQ